jgi:hypothetical protein
MTKTDLLEQEQGSRAVARPAQLPPEPSPVQRSPAEKRRILARLTLALAALNNEQGRVHGNA